MISKKIIKEIADLIAKDYNPKKIILFGSYAMGNATSESDLDLLIVSDIEKNLPRRKRGLSLLFKLRKYHFSKDILIYTKEEIEKWKNVYSAFITEINKNGVLLYGK
ncbi:MAG: nucleotidyltransferase domain-containing protein [Candidatus Cloacimonetes bacterium]|nr:nucleotidyltransferase domain-containing protein [Candidatus Cloacimonadota bacterium]